MPQVPSYGLAIHTSTPVLGLAIDNFAGDHHHQLLDLGRSLGGLLHEHLATFLQPRHWRDLKFIAVAQGPGGFTGTRMGVVVARTLAQQLDLPLFAVSSLAAYAQSQWDQGTVPQDRAIALSLPAQRQQLFVAVYSARGQSARGQSARGQLDLQRPEAQSDPPPTQSPVALVADQVVELAHWPQMLASGQWASFTAQDPVQIAIAEPFADSVVSLLALAQWRYDRGDRPHWSAALPFYGQHPVVLAS